MCFPSPPPNRTPKPVRPILGDILISIPRAAAQAQSSGHRLEEEVQLLVVHGTLHLIGHDHAEAGDKARMWAAQAEVLARLGLSHIKNTGYIVKPFLETRIRSFEYAFRAGSMFYRLSATSGSTVPSRPSY